MKSKFHNPSRKYGFTNRANILHPKTIGTLRRIIDSDEKPIWETSPYVYCKSYKCTYATDRKVSYKGKIKQRRCPDCKAGLFFRSKPYTKKDE